ncbi:MAG: ThuA domain-containing protein, partial [Flavobacteriaceae bacterium]|nr:ThuA domain-containing protein [Flavobacteriaceae bacterium]
MAQSKKVFVFSKTEGHRHESITKGIQTIQRLGAKNDFKVFHSEDADLFIEDTLKKFNAVIFLNTTGDILNENQQ